METGKIIDLSSNIDKELSTSYSMQIETKIKFLGNVKDSELSLGLGLRTSCSIGKKRIKLKII